MARPKKRWTGQVSSHGLSLTTDEAGTHYEVYVSLEMEDDPERYVDAGMDPGEAEWLGRSLVDRACRARILNIKAAASRLPVEERDRHTCHCCKWHGCKYDDEACPVVAGGKAQEYPCEECDSEQEAATEAARRSAADRRKQ